LLEANRRRLEAKWQAAWEPHGRRLSPEYQRLRQAIRAIAAAAIPPDATVAVISKGDEELLRLEGRRGWHFPQDEAGRCAHVYPADSAAALAQLESLRARGATHLLIPRPAFWWLDHYRGFGDYLLRQCGPPLHHDASCLIVKLNPEPAGG
jgi:hypothetical protein